MNQPVQKLVIASDKNVRVTNVHKAILTDSSLSGFPATKTYFVPRSNTPLMITVQVDTITKQVSLNPKISFAFWFNIVENLGVGMLVDKNNVKRYMYPSRNYFSATDTAIKISRFAPVEKRSINIFFSLPFMINQFTIKTPDGQYHSGGVYGVKTGTGYFYKRNHYVSLSGGAATDIFGEYFLWDSGQAEHGYALFASLKNNKVVGSFDFGYGIHLSQLKWRKEFGDTAKKDIVVKNVGIGPAVSTQFRVGKYFRIGIFYQPLLYDTKSMLFTNYQHYFSFDLLWALPL